MNQFFPFILPVVIMLFILASFGEMAISGMWLPAYYRYSIPLFRKEYPLTTMPDLAAKIPELEQKLKRSMWRPAIVFRVLNANEIAFRNNFGSRNAMSGLIRLEPSQGRMRISGNLYWLFLLLPLLFLVMAIISSLPIFFLTFLLAALALSLALQRYQYGQIAAVIAETAVSAEPIAADYVDATVYEPKQSFDKPIESVPYEPEYDPFTTTKPKSGINNTEIILIIVLMALLAMGVVAAILLFG